MVLEASKWFERVSGFATHCSGVYRGGEDGRIILLGGRASPSLLGAAPWLFQEAGGVGVLPGRE